MANQESHQESYLPKLHRWPLWALWWGIGLFGCGETDHAGPEIWKEPISDVEFVGIRKGSFLRSDSDSGHDPPLGTNLPEVTLSHDFWMARTEITRGQWERIMGAAERHPEKPNPFRSEDPNYPMVNISYADVQDYLANLNDLTTDWHFRLPTEAEWEYACRAGSTTAFSFGNTLADSLANYRADLTSVFSQPGRAVGHPTPVGSYKPNAWGLYDMHGNAWEWVNDWYAPYPDGPVTDPKGPPGGREKVIRGGSWAFGADNARSGARRTHGPELWGFSIGFRLVAVPRNARE